MEFVSEVIRGHNVQQQDVLGLRIQSRHSEFHLREHLPEKNRCPKLAIFQKKSCHNWDSNPQPLSYCYVLGSNPIRGQIFKVDVQSYVVWKFE